MKLSKLKIKNFRCYKDEVSFRIDDLTCIIGKNDIGKSTILEALNAFFNGIIDKGDLSYNSSSDTIEITCIFEEIPNEIVLDTTEPTNPVEECILNLNGQLEIKRSFKIGGTVSKSVHLVAHHPTDENLLNILSLKNTPLKNLALEIEADLTGVNKRKNPPLRKAIREKIESERSEIEIKVDGSLDSENNLKQIWKSIEKLLPIYSLFKVDKNIDDKDKDVQDPMNHAIKEALAVPEIQRLLETIEEKVRTQSTEVAERIIEKLKDIDESLAEKLKSDFNKNPVWNKIFDLTLLNENNVPLNKRGSGIKRLVLLSFFQAQAEKKRLEKGSPAIIYAIEEPETSQHPNHQKILINSFITLSEQEKIQVLFTTHSSNLVRELPIKSLRYISKNETNEIIIENGFDFEEDETNEVVINKIIKTLGVLPNPNDKVKVLLYVEGNNDILALKRYSKILSENNPDVINLDENEEIGIVIAGGSSLKFYIENKYLTGLGKPEIHIYDNDKQEYRDYVIGINAENNPLKKGYNTTKLELENYVHNNAIEEAYAENGLEINIPAIEDNTDIPEIVAKILYERNGDKIWGDLELDKKEKKTSKVKKMLNTQVIEKMNIERIQERNGYDDLVLWFNEIKIMCE